MTFNRVLQLLTGILSVVSACRDSDRKTAVDSASAVMPATPPLPAPPNTGWIDSIAGSILLLPVAERMDRAAIVLPFLTDSSLTATSVFPLDSLSSLPVDLFSTGGSVSSNTLTSVSQRPNAEGCLQWPQGTLADATGRSWQVGFREGIATPLALDSLESVISADSSRLTSEIARISSALAEGADYTFRGLPFSVRKAYRFRAGSVSVLIADVVRRIAEEANPREEHILLIAERAPGENGYAPAYHTRVAGSEEVVRTNELLAAVRFTRNGRPAVIVAFEYGEGGRVALLERSAERQWKISWRSAYTGC